MYVQSVQEAVVLTRILCTVNKSTGEVRPAPASHTLASDSEAMGRFGRVVIRRLGQEA